jgi:hypothetical protein
MEVSLSSFWIVAIMICVIVLILVAQVSHFYAKFQEFRKDYEANIIGLAGQLKKMQSTMSEQLGEQRRQLRALNELLELKRAEMTGDFEIVEEPIAPVPAAPAGKEEKAPEQSLPKPASQFPPINLG